MENIDQQVSRILASLQEAAPELTQQALQAIVVRGWLDLGVCVFSALLVVAGLIATWTKLLPRFRDSESGYIVSWVFTIILAIIGIIAVNSIPGAMIRILEPEGVLILRIINR